jgi:hypothetical protein
LERPCRVAQRSQISLLDIEKYFDQGNS